MLRVLGLVFVIGMVSAAVVVRKHVFERILELDDRHAKNFFTRIDTTFTECFSACASISNCMAVTVSNGICWLYSRFIVKFEAGIPTTLTRSFWKKVDCPDGYTRAGTKCFLEMNINQTQINSKATCQSQDARLVTLEDNVTSLHFHQVWKSKDFRPGHYWTGAVYKDAEWVWGESTVIDSQLFCKGQVWSRLASEECMVLVMSEDAPCLLKNSCDAKAWVVCQKILPLRTTEESPAMDV